MDKKDESLFLGYGEMTQALTRLAMVVVPFYAALVKEGLDPKSAARITGIFAAEACRSEQVDEEGEG